MYNNFLNDIMFIDHESQQKRIETSIKTFQKIKSDVGLLYEKEWKQGHVG